MKLAAALPATGFLAADCCAAQTRRLHDLSLEVLSAYRLAQIKTITAGFDLTQAPVTAPATAPAAAPAAAR